MSMIIDTMDVIYCDIFDIVNYTASLQDHIFPQYLMRQVRNGGPNYKTLVGVRSDNNKRNQVFTRKSAQF